MAYTFVQLRKQVKNYRTADDAIKDGWWKCKQCFKWEKMDNCNFGICPDCEDKNKQLRAIILDESAIETNGRKYGKSVIFAARELVKHQGNFSEFLTPHPQLIENNSRKTLPIYLL